MSNLSKKAEESAEAYLKTENIEKMLSLLREAIVIGRVEEDVELTDQLMSMVLTCARVSFIAGFTEGLTEGLSYGLPGGGDGIGGP